MEGLTEIQASKLALLSAHLSLTVPLAIGDLQARGGPTKTDLEFAAAFGATLAHKGDVLLYRGKRGEAADLVSRLARALAVLAFQPGGVEIFGLCFEAEKRND